jgi:acetone carboxylase gamma subunit
MGTKTPAVARLEAGGDKHRALRRVERLDEVSEFPLPSKEPFSGEYHEYLCPGCGTLLQVDVYCPPVGGESVLWDIALKF